MSALAWGELMCGPLLPVEESFVRAAVGVVVPVDAEDAELAARLFNATGRRRGAFADCVIAAAAIRRDAPLATTNADDFDRMRSLGLNVVTLGV
jgi:predicted nucleic acid-binding protein